MSRKCDVPLPGYKDELLESEQLASTKPGPTEPACGLSKMQGRGDRPAGRPTSQAASPRAAPCVYFTEFLRKH